MGMIEPMAGYQGRPDWQGRPSGLWGLVMIKGGAAVGDLGNVSEGATEGWWGGKG
jgi:hypothetical protein